MLEALVDSGLYGNFISHNIASKLGIPIRVKGDSYAIKGIGGATVLYNNGRIKLETILLSVICLIKGTSAGYTKIMTFDITNIGIRDIILGLPWLRKHNLIIN